MEKNNISFDIEHSQYYSQDDKKIQIEYGKDQGKDIYYSNINRTIIMITEDKLKLNAIDYEKSISAKMKIVTSFTFLASTLLSLTTSDFHEFLGINGNVISAIYIFFSIASFLYLIWNIFIYLYHKCVKRTIFRMKMTLY
ncbi:hypothetical protein [Mitsuokella multacida]|uniref:hypothetical protein n=1 Tax=Mitsuokella multacida TaxID=52226 RepID=UPI003F60BB42